MAVAKKADEAKTEEVKEDTRTFAERIIDVQNELKAPKSRHNSFGDYDYRSLEDIFEGVKGLCKKNGLLLVMTDRPTMVGDWHFVEATARLYDAKHFPTIYVENTSSARETFEKKKSDSAQITGAASSYARKYALNGLFLIDDTKDPDTNEYQRQTGDSDAKPGNNAAGRQKAGTEAADGPIGKKYAAILEKAITPVIKDWALKTYKVDSLEKLNKTQYNEIVAKVKKDEAKS